MSMISDHAYDRLGNALDEAIAAEAESDVGVARPSARRSRRRVKVVAALAAAALAVPAVAFAAGAFSSPQEVARSIPAGTLALMGTEPTCTTLREGVEYQCLLARAPQGELEAGAWQGTVEPTVDVNKHVNGGCRALNGAGTEWRCFLGREAVRQQVIGASMLGEPAPSPGVG